MRFEHRPVTSRIGRVMSWGFGLGWLAVLIGRVAPPYGPITGWMVAALGAFAAIRGGRVGVRLGEGVVVRNQWRTRSLRWDQIKSIRMRAVEFGPFQDGPFIEIEVDRARPIRVRALGDPERYQMFGRALGEFGVANGIPVNPWFRKEPLAALNRRSLRHNAIVGVVNSAYTTAGIGVGCVVLDDVLGGGVWLTVGLVGVGTVPVAFVLAHLRCEVTMDERCLTVTNPIRRYEIPLDAVLEIITRHLWFGTNGLAVRTIGRRRPVKLLGITSDSLPEISQAVEVARRASA